MLTGCFFPQTMLTAISMSAIATNGVVPGRAEPVSVCVPGVRGTGSLQVGCLGGKGLFPESIPQGGPAPWAVPPSSVAAPCH